MPHVQPLERDRAPAESRPILDAIEQSLGQSFNLFSTLAHQPDVLAGVTKINDGIENDLDPALRELAYLRASRLNGCDYCSHYHRKKAMAAGVTEAQVDAIESWRDSDAFDDDHKAVLAFAEELTKTADVADETVERVKAFTSDAAFVSLAATVGLAAFTNRVNHALGVELP